MRKTIRCFSQKTGMNDKKYDNQTKTKKTYELLHCSCLSKLKAWPQKPLRFLRRDNRLYIEVFVMHLCFWGQKNNMHVVWRNPKKTSTCFWKAQILPKNAFHMDLWEAKNNQKHTVHMFLEGERFAEVGLPNGSCLQGTPASW